MSSFDFTSLPGQFSQLLLLLQLRGDTVAVDVGWSVRLNNDSAANYDAQGLSANATTVAAAEAFAATAFNGGTVSAASAPSNVFGSLAIIIPNYAGAANNKTIQVESCDKRGTSSGNLVIRKDVGYWRSTAAINRVTIFPTSGNWVANSRATVYGFA